MDKDELSEFCFYYLFLCSSMIVTMTETLFYNIGLALIHALLGLHKP